jgi:hypothetical protein
VDLYRPEHAAIALYVSKGVQAVLKGKKAFLFPLACNKNCPTNLRARAKTADFSFAAMRMGDTNMQKIIARANDSKPLKGWRSGIEARCAAKFAKASAKCAFEQNH